MRKVNWPVFLILSILNAHLFSDVGCYLPVVMMHGISGSNTDFNDMIQMIEEAHPGTVTVSLPLFNGPESHENLWRQVNHIRDYVQNLVETNSSFANGFHWIGHSQGSLITRSVIESWPNHTVVNYISLAGPHMGEYGDVGPLLKHIAWRVYYHPIAQKHSAVAGYWHDPFHEQEYLEFCEFLPFINNVFPDSYNASYKEAFLRLNCTSLLGSDGDGVIAPWQSSQFGFYQINSTRDVVLMQDQFVYTNDTFGLQTAYNNGKIVMHSPPGVYHTDWLHSQVLFDLYILPLLT